MGVQLNDSMFSADTISRVLAAIEIPSGMMISRQKVVPGLTHSTGSTFEVTPYLLVEFKAIDGDDRQMALMSIPVGQSSWSKIYKNSARDEFEVICTRESFYIFLIERRGT